MIHMKDWKTSHVAEYLILNLCETNMRKAHDFKGSKWLVLKYVKLQRDTQPLSRILCHY